MRLSLGVTGKIIHVGVTPATAKIAVDTGYIIVAAILPPESNNNELCIWSVKARDKTVVVKDDKTLFDAGLLLSKNLIEKKVEDVVYDTESQTLEIKAENTVATVAAEGNCVLALEFKAVEYVKDTGKIIDHLVGEEQKAFLKALANILKRERERKKIDEEDIRKVALYSEVLGTIYGTMLAVPKYVLAITPSDRTHATLSIVTRDEEQRLRMQDKTKSSSQIVYYIQ